nr:unnamed protein product [Callosobruchus analis]
MQSLEAACDEGERSVKKSKLSCSSLPLLCPQDPSTSQDCIGTARVKAPFDIFAKLKELHKEEIAKNPKKLYETPLLLEKLVARERLNTLIFNLYPGNKGYSLAFRTVSCLEYSDFTDDTAADMIETNPRPYEEGNLLRYIDNEELPPYIADLLEPEFSYLFYSGCIIAEIRDYRQAYPHFKCDTHHVLLRPTLKNILADINNMVEEKPEWGAEEKDQLESQMLMANEPSLCLDPDSRVSSYIVEINNQKQIFNTQKFRRMAKKFSQVTVNRKRKLDQFTYRHGMELFEFLNRSKNKPKIGALTQKGATLSKRPSTSTCTSQENTIKQVPVPSLEPPLHLTPPTQPIVIESLKSYPRPKETSDCLPQLIEKYVLETDMPSKDKSQPRVYHIKLSILQRPSNSEYLGELYLDRDHKENEQNGVACRFSLGSKANANRYIHQFTEIFTESGKKAVRIRYGSSPSYKERIAMAQAQAQLQVQGSTQGQPNLAQQHLSQLSQSLHAQTLVNGSIGVQSTSSVPILQSHLQGVTQQKATSQALSNQEQAINALATKLMNSAQQFQAAEQQQLQQQQQQHQQKLSTNNAAIINLLNSPASVANSDASAAVVNAINSGVVGGTATGQQYLGAAIGQKLLARKMAAASPVTSQTAQSNARVLNHGGLIALNSNRLQELQQQAQTITLTSMGGSGNYTSFTTVPVKQQGIVNSSSDSNKSALSALLVGTPAADRPDIIGPNTSSLLLEKLGAATATPPQFGQTTSGKPSSAPAQQFLVQSPKAAVASPMSSPPLAQPSSQTTVQPATQAVNVQGLNFAQLQSIPGIQNLQVQLPGFAQPISLSLNVSSTGNMQAHPTAGLIVSLPITTAAPPSNTVTQSTANAPTVNSLGVQPQTVVLTNAGTSNLAQLVTSGIKGIPQQAVRTSLSGQQVTAQPFQLITTAPLQRPRLQQGAAASQTARTVLQRAPITIKMAAPNTSQSTDLQLPKLTALNSDVMQTNSGISNQRQKQAQLQQFQQVCLGTPNLLGNRRRSSNQETQ